MTPADSIAALEAELAEARRQYAERETAYWDDFRAAERELEAERAAHARMQAEAAAMRALLQEGIGDAPYESGWIARVSALLGSSDAGRALADRVPLWRELQSSLKTCEEHGDKCGGYGVWLKDHARARKAMHALAALDEKRGA